MTGTTVAAPQSQCSVGVDGKAVTDCRCNGHRASIVSTAFFLESVGWVLWLVCVHGAAPPNEIVIMSLSCSLFPVFVCVARLARCR